MNFELTRELRINFNRTQKIMSKKIQFQKLYGEEYFSRVFDMIWLRHQLWPVLQNQSLIFDSYRCMMHDEMGVGHPFPTQ